MKSLPLKAKFAVLRFAKDLKIKCPYLEFEDIRQDLFYETLVAKTKWKQHGGKSFLSFLITRLRWYCSWYQVKEAKRYHAETHWKNNTITYEVDYDPRIINFLLDLPAHTSKLNKPARQLFNTMWSTGTKSPDICKSAMPALDRTYLAYHLGLTKRSIRRHLQSIKYMLQEMQK